MNFSDASGHQIGFLDNVYRNIGNIVVKHFEFGTVTEFQGIIISELLNLKQQRYITYIIIGKFLKFYITTTI